MVVFFPLLANPADIENWDNREYWEEKMLPSLAPPVWANALDPHPYPVTQDLSQPKIYVEVYDYSNFTQFIEFMKKIKPELNQLPQDVLEKALKPLWETEKQRIGKIVLYRMVYTYDFTAYKRPLDIIFKMRFDIGNILYKDMRQGFGIFITRPDNITISLIPGYSYPTNLYDINQYADLRDTKWLNALSIPYVINSETKTVSIPSDEDWYFSLNEYGSEAQNLENGLGIILIVKPILDRAGETLTPGQSIDLMTVLFSKAEKGVLKGESGPLNGVYKFEFIFLFRLKPEDRNIDPKIIPERAVVGGAYGLLGTDKWSRDLWPALIYGVRWALLIGIITALVSTLWGVIYGMTSAYIGGAIDVLMQRVAQVVYSLPVLPLLIMFTYFIGRSIWLVVFVLIVFGWVGIQFVVRSMVLQIKEQTYIEAAKSLGASNKRILFRYIFPQLLPYSFASMALSVPGAILAEAGLSFIGLGDPSIVTWGKLLHDAQIGGAVLANAWWWVLPPGLMIAITALTFVMIGMALEKIIEPRLRTR